MFIAINNRLRSEDEDGFTLIELLVVVIIIGILAAIAIPTFLRQRERGYQAELTSDVRNAALDVEARATAAGGVYPADDAANTAFVVAFSSGDTTFDYNVAGNAFCIVGTRTNLPGSIAYRSAGGGLQNYASGGTLTCTP